MKRCLFVVLSLGCFMLGSLCTAQSFPSADEGFMTMYRDWLTPFMYQYSILTASGGIAEEGLFALEVSGSSYEYRTCEYTGVNYDDYVCQESVTPLSTTSLMTRLTMPYRVAVRPSKRANIMDMSMAVDLHMALSFTDGTNNITIPDAHIAGKVIMKNNTRNVHFYLSAFDVSLDGTVMDLANKEEMQAVITLIKSKLLHTWYFARIDKAMYDEFVTLMHMSQIGMPIDMESVMKAGIIDNLGRDSKLGRYRITIHTDRLPTMLSAFIEKNMMTDRVQEEYTENDKPLILSGLLGPVAAGPVVLTLDNITLPVEEGTNLDLSDCSLAAAGTSCKVMVADGSGNSMTIIGSGYNTVSSGAISLSASLVSKEAVGTASVSSQRRQTLIRDNDFTLPHRSHSRKKIMEGFDTML